MNELVVHTSTHSYNIYIDEQIRYQISKFIANDYSSIFIISDDQVAPLYLDDIMTGIETERIFHTVIPSGEASKNIDQYYRLQTIAMEKKLDRRSLIIALGGGVVGDLAGFVAATFMRGIDYIQVPTTILAHDSSVGGKVAINHELGKNMIGNFYPPKAVIYDVNTLKTLPDHEIRSGYAELIKEAFIANAEFLQQLLPLTLATISNDQLKDHLFQGVKIKADIVEKDEKELNIRKFLNFGHTLAHALEAELGYGKITHGEAVAIGMLFALKISEHKYNKSLYYDQLLNWLQGNNYPLSLFHTGIDQLINAMKLDKKAQYQQIQMVLLSSIGKPVVVNLTDDELHSYLQSFKKELSAP
ncbi:3-dehydroquinate synthase [Pseudogracilibacillus auburnensis]|uniref:3-dehydroquinate synthase n=1 Tax=Pseudogracilibacillus auburnensis TaxID=1494959 RepID=A0A2V3W376_9BACI|nr:3-dehydroquinate synthase [Pseudogracilibacillus auburnensis]MBO1003049.1 3-dehydroquinate synthase [Pseudogracilibacillus auburnensis]PXW88747.1 3-dehydroquinate synthase [Pseudogracilibacillus auburnensis]